MTSDNTPGLRLRRLNRHQEPHLCTSEPREKTVQKRPATYNRIVELIKNKHPELYRWYLEN